MGLKEDLWEATHNLCDKCGRPVPAANDMVRVMAELPGCEALPAVWYSRHFLPVEEDGEVVCEGSPSRAQYLEGQPRDTRGFPYIEALEGHYREAWARLQARVRSQADGSSERPGTV